MTSGSLLNRLSDLQLDEYKPNCRLVLIDLAIRRGLFTPEQPGYLSLLRSLRTGDHY